MDAELGEVGARAGLARDEQDGVVAADRAGDLGEICDIEGAGDRHRVAGRGTQDQQVAGRLDAAHEAQHLAQPRRRVDRRPRRAARTPCAAAAHPHGPEAIEVARDGRLRDVDVLGGEQLDELPLRGHLAAVEDGRDDLMAWTHHA